jgi:methyltransferase (TIGR00027 family)
MDSSSRRSTTAEGAAFCRALGALEPDERLRNPDVLARHFVTRRGWKMGLLPVLRGLARRSVERQVPGGMLLHQVRTRVFDALTLAALRDGVEQVVVLGAGGDSRGYRFPRERAGARFFEVDHPTTSAWKRGCVDRMLGRLPANVRYVPVDFGVDALHSSLQAAGFDDRARAFFLWEGVCMYLPMEAIDAVLSFVAGRPAGSSIAFDYLYADAIAHAERFEGASQQAAFAASKGEPFVSGLAPEPEHLIAFLKARTLELVTSWNHEQLRARYPGPGFLMPYVGIAHAGPAPTPRL